MHIGTMEEEYIVCYSDIIALNTIVYKLPARLLTTNRLPRSTFLSN